MNLSACSVQFSSVQHSSVQFSPLTDWVVGGGGGHEGRFSRYLLPDFSAGGPCEQFWHGQGCPLFDVVHPAFPLPRRSKADKVIAQWFSALC